MLPYKFKNRRAILFAKDDNIEITGFDYKIIVTLSHDTPEYIYFMSKEDFNDFYYILVNEMKKDNYIILIETFEYAKRKG